MLVLDQLIEDRTDQSSGVPTIRCHVSHDHCDIDIFCTVPAVVVGRHADHLVDHLGFAGELGFGEGRHVDYGAAPGAIHVGFGTGRELGSFC